MRNLLQMRLLALCMLAFSSLYSQSEKINLLRSLSETEYSDESVFLEVAGFEYYEDDSIRLMTASDSSFYIGITYLSEYTISIYTTNYSDSLYSLFKTYMMSEFTLYLATSKNRCAELLYDDDTFIWMLSRCKLKGEDLISVSCINSKQ